MMSGENPPLASPREGCASLTRSRQLRGSLDLLHIHQRSGRRDAASRGGPYAGNGMVRSEDQWSPQRTDRLQQEADRRIPGRLSGDKTAERVEVDAPPRVAEGVHAPRLQGRLLDLRRR